MTILEAVILGAVQGFTEFLPISSSGHLILFPAVLGWEAQSVVFDVAVHVATLGAILVALRPRISAWIKELRRGSKTAWRLAMYLALATIPAGLLGIFGGDWLEGQRTLPMVGIMLIFWGIILYIADVIAVKLSRTVVKDGQITLPFALAIGVAQALALFPGTSRSGASMSTAMLLGFDRKTAANFSFLLAIPAISGAGLVTALDISETGLDVPIVSLVAGCLVAFITGIFAIRFLFAVIEKGGFRWFALYRVVLGVLVLSLFYASS
ncbi:undecaprenyl-diphosphate phosphatase [bacterium]|nr:undecaprenyl-diphosphate phosphatase [bacterium]